MKTNLQKHFGLVEDVRPVKDPWGIGIIFGIAREGNSRYQEWLRQTQRKSPTVMAISQALIRKQLELVANGTQVERSDETMQAVMSQAIKEAAKDLEVTAEDVEMLYGQNLEGFQYRVWWWQNLKDIEGKDVEYSPESLKELLQSPEWVDPEEPYGGKSLGLALQEWIVEESRRHEQYRQKYLEDASKNSEKSSPGEQAGGGAN